MFDGLKSSIVGPSAPRKPPSESSAESPCVPACLGGLESSGSSKSRSCLLAVAAQPASRQETQSAAAPLRAVHRVAGWRFDIRVFRQTSILKPKANLPPEEWASSTVTPPEASLP